MKTSNTHAHAFANEASSEQVAQELMKFNIASGNGLFVAQTAHNTAIIVTRKAIQSPFADDSTKGYAHQIDTLVNTKVVKCPGNFEGVAKLNLEFDFSDDYTVIALFDDQAVIIEVAPFEGAVVVDRFQNHTTTNLYSEVELTDL